MVDVRSGWFKDYNSFHIVFFRRNDFNGVNDTDRSYIYIHHTHMIKSVKDKAHRFLVPCYAAVFFFNERP